MGYIIRVADENCHGKTIPQLISAVASLEKFKIHLFIQYRYRRNKR
jgi:hypothetical protein